MPLPEQRLNYIRWLANAEGVEDMDTSEFTDEDWARLSRQRDEEISQFCRGTTDPEELHAFADAYNWDQGEHVFFELIKNPMCDAGTALLIYWRAGPEWHLQFTDRTELHEADATMLDLINEIERRYLADDFKSKRIPFDPAEYVGAYEKFGDNFKRNLPARMYESISGL